MKYYSEVTKEMYDNVQALKAAEKAAEEAKNGRAEAAKKVTEALKESWDAQKKADKLLDEFLKKYGSFKTTIKDTENTPFHSSFSRLIDNFLGW